PCSRLGYSASRPQRSRVLRQPGQVITRSCKDDQARAGRRADETGGGWLIGARTSLSALSMRGSSPTVKEVVYAKGVRQQSPGLPRQRLPWDCKHNIKPQLLRGCANNVRGQQIDPTGLSAPSIFNVASVVVDDREIISEKCAASLSDVGS